MTLTPGVAGDCTTASSSRVVQRWRCWRSWKNASTEHTRYEVLMAKK